ncbi:TPA: hypothetical protein U6I48_002129 [Klebsiella aerogenes]|nr:hypothetical protein [Klebsiella aerogenes]
MNNQGCFPELGSNTNRITALRTQRDDIIRPTGTPYLVLRTTPSGGKITDGDAIILLSDQPSISAFTCECAIAVGSTTGEWFLFDEENYQGRITKVTVGGGSEHNIGNGFYSFDENVIVRSARMAPPDAETGPWMRYSPNYCKTFRVVNKYDYTITLKTIWEDGSHNEEDFPNDDFIDYTIDYNQKALTRNGKKIAQISLNGGYSAEDIYTGGNTVFYSTYRDQSGHAIFTFDTYEYVNWIVESSGVDGGPAAKLWLDNATVPEFLTMTIRRA